MVLNNQWWLSLKLNNQLARTDQHPVAIGERRKFLSNSKVSLKINYYNIWKHCSYTNKMHCQSSQTFVESDRSNALKFNIDLNLLKDKILKVWLGKTLLYKKIYKSYIPIRPSSGSELCTSLERSLKSKPRTSTFSALLMNIGKQLLRTNPQNLIMISSSLTLFTAFESLTSSYCNNHELWKKLKFWKLKYSTILQKC